MTAPLELSWCDRGEVIDVEGLDGRAERQMVMSPCACRTRGYYCATCRARLANIGNALLHIEEGGAHRLVTYCPTCRVYEAAERSQVAAFAQIIPGEAAS